MDLNQQAQAEAETLERRVFMYDLLRRMRGESNTLLPFDAVSVLRPSGEHYLGVRTIEVDKIIGSVDRYEDFDAHFLPKVPHTLERWTRMRGAQLQGVEFPPIQVYKVGEVYFVKDGNHRTALAKSENAVYIDAEIIELDVPVELEPGDTLKDLILKGEYARFLETTHLSELRPQHESIEFSTAGRYDILLEHIHTHQYYMGLEQKRHITRKEAVADWYDHLYLPTIQEIRESGILRGFPGRTEADLYLWVSDHRFYLSKELGHDIGVEEATRAVQQQIHKNPFMKVLEWISRLFQRRPIQST